MEAMPERDEDKSIWIEEIVERNAELLRAIAENQALGRLADAVAYQEVFQENVFQLCQFCDLSNEVLDAADATMGGIVDAESAAIRPPPTRPMEDDPDAKLMVDAVPCAECKRKHHTGHRCRYELKHLAPNYDYVEDAALYGAAPANSKVDDVAAFEAFQRERLRALDKASAEALAKRRKVANAAPPQRTGAAAPAAQKPAPAPAPKMANHRRRWTDEEHANFLKGFEKYGKKGGRHIATEFVKTRTPDQVRSHMQKYLKKLESDAAKARAAAAAAGGGS